MKQNLITFILVGAVILFLPEIGYSSVESTLRNIQNTFIGRLMPLCAILGLCYSAFSFVTGDPAAKTHMKFAIIGAAIGFGAPSIVALIQRIVQ